MVTVPVLKEAQVIPSPLFLLEITNPLTFGLTLSSQHSSNPKSLRADSRKYSKISLGSNKSAVCSRNCEIMSTGVDCNKGFTSRSFSEEHVSYSGTTSLLIKLAALLRKTVKEPSVT